MLMKSGHPSCLLHMFKHFDTSTYQQGAHQHLLPPESFSSDQTPSLATSYIHIHFDPSQYTHPNNDSHTRPLQTPTFWRLCVSISSTLSYIHLESRPETFPITSQKSLPHYHNASPIPSPFPSCCCRQEARTSSATQSNVKIPFLARIPKIESSANA